MKVLFAGGNFCSGPTFKRLLALAEEICFTDRPSITFNRPVLRREDLGRHAGSWGTVGVSSTARAYLQAFEGKAVRLSVAATPSGPASQLYLDYIAADLDNLDFRKVLLDGLRDNPIFATKFVGLDANYGSCTGREVIAALTQDDALTTAVFNDPLLATHPYSISDGSSRRETLKMLLVEASIHLTNAILFCAKGELVPVTDDPLFATLLAMRLSDRKYVGGSSVLAPLLGLEVMKSVIPDEVLGKISVGAILDYREEAKSAHAAWSAEIGKLATQLDEVPPDELAREVPRLIAADITPNMIEYRHDMEAVRDRLFGDLVKSVTNWKLPTISIAAVTYLTFHSAMSAFAGFFGSAVASAIPAIVDTIVDRRQVQRNHAMSYLVGISEL